MREAYAVLQKRLGPTHPTTLSTQGEFATLLHTLGVTSMSFGGFVLFKSSYTALAGLIVTPQIALLGLASAAVAEDGLRRGSAA